MSSRKSKKLKFRNSVGNKLKDLGYTCNLCLFGDTVPKIIWLKVKGSLGEEDKKFGLKLNKKKKQNKCL